MRSIDVHAHLTPQCFWQATERGDWHTIRREKDARGREQAIVGGKRQVLPPRARWNPEERLADMDSLGVDVQVVSPYVGFYNYHLETAVAAATSRDCNAEIAGMVRAWTERFAGLGTLPMQDVKSAISELQRCMTRLGLKGAEITDHPLPPAEHDREPGGPGGDPRDPGVGRRHGRIPRPQDVARPWRRLHLLRHRTPGPRMAGARGGARAHHEAPERVPPALLLRLHRLHGAGAPLPHRHRGRRPGGVRDRLALRHGAGLARLLDPRHGYPVPGGEGGHPLEEPREAAEPMSYG